MNLFSTLAEYKFAVINTSYRNATLLDKCARNTTFA